MLGTAGDIEDHTQFGQASEYSPLPTPSVCRPDIIDCIASEADILATERRGARQSREEDAYRVEADEWWQVFDGGKDVLQGCSAELAGGCEGSSPPRKCGHSITRDEARLELDMVGMTDYWGWHQRCLFAGSMSDL